MTTVLLPSTTLARRTRMASVCGVSLLLGTLCNAALAQAPAVAPAPAASPAMTEADALILQGLQLREQGNDLDALQLFERAHALAPSPRALAQRALAEQALGRWVPAEVHLREALAARDDPWIAQYRTALDGALAVIGEHLGHLQVNGGVAGATLRLDGRPVGRLPLSEPLRVVVGRPLLEVTLAGHYPVRREITIKAGSLSTETIELVPVPALAPAAGRVQEPATRAGAEQRIAAEPRDAGGLSPVVFWTAAGVTAAVGAVALWSGLNTVAKNDAYVDYSEEESATDRETLRGLEAAQDAQTRTNVLLAGTAVAAAATLVIGVLFTDWDGQSGPEADARASATAVRVTAYAGSTGHGLLLQRRF